MKPSPATRAGERLATERGGLRIDAPLPPGGRTRRLLEVERDVVRLRWRADHDYRARVLYWCAALWGVGMLVFAFIDAEMLWLELLLGVPLALAFISGLVCRETRFHFDRQLMFQGKRDAAAHGVPFAEIAGISATAQNDVVKGDYGSFELPRFVLGVLLGGAGTPLRETLDAIRSDRVALVHQPAAHELVHRLEWQALTRVVEVADCDDELAVWQASEWLAKTLDVPLVDASASPLSVRVPEEFELPLGERLAQGLQPLDVAGAYANAPAPEGATVVRLHDKCTLTWRQDRSSEINAAAALSILFLVFGTWLGTEDDIGLWVFAGFGICVLPLVSFVSRWHGTNALAIDRERVVVTRGPFGRQLPALATDSLAAVRVAGTRQSPLLTLVSDQRVLRLRMPPDLARWAKRHIERHLLAIYQERSLPSRQRRAGVDP